MSLSQPPTHSTPSATLTLAGTLAGARGIAPVAMFVVPFGMAFGVAATQKGLSTLEAVVMSTLVCAGASQFAALDLWSQSLPVVAILVVTFAVNARHLLYGAALYPWLRALSPGQRFPILAVLTDTSWAFSTEAQARGERDAGLLLGSGATLWLVWIASTWLGARLGQSIADPKAFGLDVVMPAFFAANLAGLWRGRDDLVPWIAAAAGAVAGYLVLPTGWHVILGAFTGALAGLVRDEL